MPYTHGHRMVGPRKNPIRREPVATAALVPVVVWLAAVFGFEVDKETATMIAGALLVLGNLVARQLVTPTVKQENPREG